MGDLFHENVPFMFIKRVFEVMHEARLRRGHIFQILTKRPVRMLEALGPKGTGWYAVAGPVLYPEPCVWLGVSIEDRPTSKLRIPILRETPAVVRFLSIEPLLDDLGELDLRGIHWVIVGGESGPRSRPCNIEWIRSILAQCRAVGVPCFIKQLGANPVFDCRHYS